MARHKNIDWVLSLTSPASLGTVRAALLMDIRDELKQLNAVFACANARSIPGLLRSIVINMRKKRIVR